MHLLHGFFGMACLLALAFALSEDRRSIPLRVVVAGVALQTALAILLFKFPPARALHPPVVVLEGGRALAARRIPPIREDRFCCPER